MNFLILLSLLSLISCGINTETKKVISTDPITDNQSTHPTSPIKPTSEGSEISEEKTLELINQYQDQLLNVLKGMQFYSYEINEFTGMGESLPDLQCSDFIIYKKTVLKVENNLIYLFVEKDSETQQNCPNVIINNNCIEIINNQLQQPPIDTGAEIKYFQTNIDNSPAILLKATYLDSNDQKSKVIIEAASVLNTVHLISSYVEVQYYYLENAQEINIANNTYYTGNSTNIVDVSNIDTSQIPNCIGQ